MYPNGSILRYFPTTPMPSSVLESSKKNESEAEQYYAYYSWRRAPVPKRKPAATHYAAIVLSSGILQVKPTKQMFNSVEEWCASMHECPLSMEHLLDHAKALKETKRKYANAQQHALKCDRKIEKAMAARVSSARTIKRLEEQMAYHEKHLSSEKCVNH